MVADDLEDGQEWDGKGRFFADERLFGSFKEFARMRFSPDDEPSLFYRAIPVYLRVLEPEDLWSDFVPEEATIEELTPPAVWEAFQKLNKEIKKSRDAGEVFCWTQGDEIPRDVIERLREDF